MNPECQLHERTFLLPHKFLTVTKRCFEDKLHKLMNSAEIFKSDLADSFNDSPLELKVLVVLIVKFS